MHDLPTIEDVHSARTRIASHVLKTPLLESPILNKKINGRLLVKAESLQTTGSFKIRGAINCVLQLDKDELSRGLVASSSGNHAQAIAYAASLFKTHVKVVMPDDAPAVKIEKTRLYGGEVILCDRFKDDRNEVARDIAKSENRIFVPPYDAPHIIAGQGTVALEAIEQARDMGLVFDDFLICCSGGGLTAGCCLALKAESPATKIHAVEPDEFNDTQKSIALGMRVSNEIGAQSICDSIMINTPGALTFEINKRLLDSCVTVSDEAVLKAIVLAMTELKIVIEPGGAAALAAVLEGKIDVKGRTIGVVSSGGNIDTKFISQSLDLL